MEAWFEIGIIDLIVDFCFQFAIEEQHFDIFDAAVYRRQNLHQDRDNNGYNNNSVSRPNKFFLT